MGEHPIDKMNRKSRLEQAPFKELQDQIDIIDNNFKLNTRKKWKRMDNLEERMNKLSNIFLNIKLNSNLALKVMRLEQREIGKDQEIFKLYSKIDKLSKRLDKYDC